MLDNISHIQKIILKEFLKTHSFYFAANSICEKHGISIVISKKNLELYYTNYNNKNDDISKLFKINGTALDIIWSCVLLYRDLIEEKYIYDYNIVSEYAVGDLGDTFDTSVLSFSVCIT